MHNLNLIQLLYFLAGALFIVSAILGGNNAFYALGFCFIVHGKP